MLPQWWSLFHSKVHWEEMGVREIELGTVERRRGQILFLEGGGKKKEATSGIDENGNRCETQLRIPVVTQF